MTAQSCEIGFWLEFGWEGEREGEFFFSTAATPRPLDLSTSRPLDLSPPLKQKTKNFIKPHPEEPGQLAAKGRAEREQGDDHARHVVREPEELEVQGPEGHRDPGHHPDF